MEDRFSPIGCPHHIRRRCDARYGYAAGRKPSARFSHFGGGLARGAGSSQEGGGQTPPVRGAQHTQPAISTSRTGIRIWKDAGKRHAASDNQRVADHSFTGQLQIEIPATLLSPCWIAAQFGAGGTVFHTSFAGNPEAVAATGNAARRSHGRVRIDLNLTAGSTGLPGQ